MAVKSKKVKTGRISKVKRSNQRHAKLGKQGKLKKKHHKKKVQGFNPPEVVKHVEDDRESDHGEDMLTMVEPEDLNYIKKSITNKSYSFLKKLRFNREDDADEDRSKKQKVEEEDDEDNVEALYEERKLNESSATVTKHLLPFKTKHGLIHRSMEQEIKEEPEEAVTVKQEEDVEQGSDMEMEALGEYTLDLADPISTAQLLATREQRLRQYKYMIGSFASALLEEPEEKIGILKKLLDLLNDPSPEVILTARKLAALSLLEVFRDLLPAYHIKHQEIPGVKLKKETQKLHNYEKTLLKGYKMFLQALEQMVVVLLRKPGAPRISEPERRLAELALDCLCSLLEAHPYFNFSTNLARLLVPFLDNRLPSVRQRVAACFRNVFRGDKRGELSLDMVRAINRLVRSRSHNVSTEALSVLLSLRIKDVNLDREKEEEIKQKKFKTRRQKVLQMSRTERKRSKKLEELERELLETKAEENKAAKMKYMTESTKVVFTIYFRILKRDPSSQLLSLTLEGLARFAHCINVDFYHDLVTVLDRLVASGDLGAREQLHCVQTVFTILSGQGEALNLDPNRFYRHLYQNLLHVTAGRSHADLPIVLNALNSVLVKRRKKISLQRLLSFTKRLTTLSLQLLHNGSLGCLGLVRTVLQLSKAVDILLDTDTSIGQGVYYPELEDPEYCNASNTALWELLLLERHYHPMVQRFARNILLGAPSTGEGSLPPELSKQNAEELFATFDPSEVAFNPPVPVPKSVRAKKKTAFSRHEFKDKELEQKLTHTLDADFGGTFDFSAGLLASG